MDRRGFITSASAGLLTSLVSARVSFASVPTDNRLVFILLRGGLDGLHALPPHADPDYHALRPRLGFGAMNSDLSATDLDGYFGLHPALAPLLPLYRDKDLAFLPAATTSYRARSHFDGQNMLESGSNRPFGSDDGWLNRAIALLNAGDRRMGLALGPAVPLILQGDARIQTWADTRLPEVDEDFLMRVSMVYQSDRLFAEALHEATGVLRPDVDKSMMQDGPAAERDFLVSTEAAGELLASDTGPRIAVMEMQGWDTHFDQERRLNNLLGSLAKGVLNLRDKLRADWDRTAIVVVSEFGRTVAENSSRGTDHGTGGLAILAGGAINGGRVAGDWPGLKPGQLFEDRDLLALNSYESLFKTLLIEHLGLDGEQVENHVFPGSRNLTPMGGVLLS